jgi:hypothetical protein
VNALVERYLRLKRERPLMWLALDLVQAAVLVGILWLAFGPSPAVAAGIAWAALTLVQLVPLVRRRR